MPPNRPGLLKAVRQQPNPLYYHPKRILFIWTPKCACTNILWWYFWHCGLSHAAAFYHPWPHRFRMHVLRHSATYQNWLNQIQPKETRAIQFVRDPINRCISSYRHALRTDFIWDHIQSVMKERVSPETGFSLQFFLDYLNKYGVTGDIDVHCRSQVPMARKFFDIEIVDVDNFDLFAVFDKIEDQMNMSKSDIENDRRLQKINERHNAKKQDVQSVDETTVFTRSDAINAWPDLASHISNRAREYISEIYKADYKFISERPKMRGLDQC